MLKIIKIGTGNALILSSEAKFVKRIYLDKLLDGQLSGIPAWVKRGWL